MLMGSLLCCAPALAENFTVTGEMGSAIRYELKEQVTAGEGIRRLVLSFVIPQSFSSPTYRQEIENFTLQFLPKPGEEKKSDDGRGNRIITATWSSPPASVEARMAFHARNETIL